MFKLEHQSQGVGREFVVGWWWSRVLLARRPETLAIPRQPLFQVNAPAANNTAPLVGVPLVVPCAGGFFVRFNWDAGQVFGLTPEAQTALDEFKAALDEAGAAPPCTSLRLGTAMLRALRKVKHNHPS
jgi:hypothetical protein